MIVSYDVVMLQKENIELKQKIENLKTYLIGEAFNAYEHSKDSKDKMARWKNEGKLDLCNDMIDKLKITPLVCTCGEKLTLICKKKTPLYYIFRHICAELDMEIHGCEKCGLKVAKVPEQIFRETKEQQEEYIKEVMKGVSIL